MRCDAMRCDAMRCDAMQCNTIQEKSIVIFIGLYSTTVNHDNSERSTTRAGYAESKNDNDGHKNCPAT